MYKKPINKMTIDELDQEREEVLKAIAELAQLREAIGPICQDLKSGAIDVDRFSGQFGQRLRDLKEIDDL